jgi:transcriptional regulator with XRE-family HTH domain
MGEPNNSAYPLRKDVIERLRIEKGLSLRSLASEAGLDLATLRRWRKGKPAYLENIASLAKALGVAVQEIIEQPQKTVSTEPIKRVRITIHYDVDFDNFTKADETTLMTALQKLIATNNQIVVAKVEAGSVKLTLELDLNDAMRFYGAIRQIWQHREHQKNQLAFAFFYDETLKKTLNVDFSGIEELGDRRTYFDLYEPPDHH